MCNFWPSRHGLGRDQQMLHRARSRLVGERTALINQLRSVLLNRALTKSGSADSLQR